MNEKVKLAGNVIAILDKGDFIDGKWVPVHRFQYVGNNIVTNDGDTYYAQKGCIFGNISTATGLTYNFISATAGILLGSGTTGGGEKTDTSVKTACSGNGNPGNTSGQWARLYTTGTTTIYPRTNDTEANNSGATTDCVTYYYYWGTANGSSTKINEGAIRESATGGSKCLCHFDFGTTFDKTTADTLQVFVNHTMAGA